MKKDEKTKRNKDLLFKQIEDNIYEVLIDKDDQDGIKIFVYDEDDIKRIEEIKEENKKTLQV
jgi:hypothetical protein